MSDQGTLKDTKKAQKAVDAIEEETPEKATATQQYETKKTVLEGVLAVAGIPAKLAKLDEEVDEAPRVLRVLAPTLTHHDKLPNPSRQPT